MNENTAKILAKIGAEEPPTPPPLLFPPPLSFDEFKSERGAEVLVEGGLVQREMLTMLSAPAKARKSWLLYALATALATGREWLGFKVNRKCKTLFVDLEVFPHDLEQRFKRIAAAGGCKPGSNLVVCPWRHVSIQPGARAQAVVNEVLRLAGTGFDVVILDSVYLLLDGDESDPQAVADLLRPIVGLLRSTGAAVVFSHHYAKGSASMQAVKSAIDRASGSSYWSRFADVLLPLTPPLPDQNPEKKELLILEPEVRHHVRPAPMVLEWNPERLTFSATEDNAGELLTPLTKKEREKKNGKFECDPDQVSSCLQRLDKLTTKALSFRPEDPEECAELERRLKALDTGENVVLPMSCWVESVKWEKACRDVISGQGWRNIVKHLLDEKAIFKKTHDKRAYYRSGVPLPEV
jgi:hypothetical protein